MPSKFAGGIILKWLKSPFTPVQATQDIEVIFNNLFCCLKGYGDFMKKFLAVIAAVLSVAIILVACTNSKSNNNGTTKNNDDKSKISIVTTIFPEYDWVGQILGENQANVDLTMLLDNGVDLHSYQPSADDMVKMSKCDLFIYVGGESDAWVDDALKSAQNKNMKVINLLDVLGNSVKEEEQVEGMQAEEEEEEGEEEGPEYDEHVWLSLKNAKTLCSSIADALCEIDSKNADVYKKNLDEYTKNLDALDKEYQQVVNSAKYDTLVFGDRFPFRYMVDDYSLKYYAAFVGCSAETEASFETIKFLANKVDELGVTTVLTIENPKHKIAQTVVENTKEKNQKILALNSMQSVTSNDVKNGETYLNVMQSNLDVLKQALN